jgi:hypothetical protein
MATGDAQRGFRTPLPQTDGGDRVRVDDRERRIYLWEASNLLAAGVEASPAVVRVNDVAVWSGSVSALSDAPEVVEIDLSEPLPKSGSLAVEVTVGGAQYAGRVTAQPGAALEVWCVSRHAGIEFGWNTGQINK